MAHDVHSIWPEIATTNTVTSSAIIQILKEQFSRWGIPDVLQSDNGPQFVSYEFEMFLQKLGIEHRRSALYNPQCNGGMERLNRVIKESLGAQLKEEETFTDAVRTILQTYRSTPHTLTQRTPAELMIGRKLRFTLECMKPPQTQTPIITVLAESIRRKQERTKAYTDKRRHSQDTSMKRGDRVRTKRPIRKHKLGSSLSYSKRFAKKIGPNTFVLEDGSRWNSRRCVRSRQVGPPHMLAEETLHDDDVEGLPAPQLGDPHYLRQRPRRNRRPLRYIEDYQTYQMIMS